MLTCFNTVSSSNSTPITVIQLNDFDKWLANQSIQIKQWLTTTQFCAKSGAFCLLPDPSGKLSLVICCIADADDLWGVGALPFALPEGDYLLDIPEINYSRFAIAWGLGAYQFTLYKKPSRPPANLVLPATCQLAEINNLVSSIYYVRDWINTPTDNMGPSEFAAEAVKIGKEFGAKVKQIVGDDLLLQNYAAIHAVGRASDDAPRLIDIRWGDKKHPKLTLVGKGVCFDTGGLDIKPSSYMALMKKDMGGAAHTLGLARMIMQAQLPIQLRVLMPVVENAIAGNAYRPGDVIRSRKGLTIEIGNTDAEGRVVLADALAEAVSDKPDLLIDIATLTGAARVALGTELPAMFANNDDIANAAIHHAQRQQDPVWRLPLFSLYRDMLNSTIADINNDSASSYGGAIAAALFLKEFVPDDIPWLHFDLMAWNLKARPGRPQGGEAMGLRALFSYLKAWAIR
ncbi:MAG: leucyl aminopeptidase [Gammaproteobacteria bacterium RIFCSPHIGHO2_12_FULL_41_20]|nr:MAG: leucyl aminopeptidase [Gammaproteobacteria bacterium RIFCSPHIGHO2_12_FULL_41_20]